MFWVKPNWTEIDSGDYKTLMNFQVYNNLFDLDDNWNILLYANADEGTVLRIRDEEGAPHVVLAADNDADQSTRWYAGTNQWVQLAMSWDNTTGIVKLYIDGELAASEYAEWTPKESSLLSDIWFGDFDRFDYEGEWRGIGDSMVDNIHIYNRQLSDFEVQYIHNSEEP